MFSVPGWNLATKTPVISKDRPSSLRAETRSENVSRPKKRKRGPVVEATDSDVSPAALERVWNKHFHGQSEKEEEEVPSRRKKGKKSKGKGEAKGPKEDASQVPERIPKGKLNDEPKGGNDGAPAKGKVDAKIASKQRPRSKSNGDGSGNADSPVGNENWSITNLKPKPKLHTDLPSQSPKLTPLQQSMRAKLISARFRHLNETLYTSPSEKALALFSENPEMFAEYHAGFSQQVKESWPENPVDLYINSVKTRAKIPFKLGKEGKMLPSEAKTALPLPRRPHGTCTIADLGCGDAQLARGLQSSMKSLNLKFHNFDLHPANSLVTKADISALPLKDGETDMVVFCLSLMGTNWITFVEEAWRILRGDGRGEVWVAEVKSRFGRMEQNKKGSDAQAKKKQKSSKAKNRKDTDDDGDDGNGSTGEELFVEIDGPSGNAGAAAHDETDISGFVEVFRRRGFSLRQGSVNKDNKMFVSMVFNKVGVPSAGKWKGMKWNGIRYEQRTGGSGGSWHGSGDRKRFLDHRSQEQDVSPEEERKVLKPCVYKIR